MINYSKSIYDVKSPKCFFHVKIEESSRKYAAFVTHEVEYEFLRSLSGLCMYDNQFQMYVKTLFQDLLQEGTITVCVGDFVISLDDGEDGIKKMQQVSEVASVYGVKDLSLYIFLLKFLRAPLKSTLLAIKIATPRRRHATDVKFIRKEEGAVICK